VHVSEEIKKNRNRRKETKDFFFEKEETKDVCT
jgi:hypothetical protein